MQDKNINFSDEIRKRVDPRTRAIMSNCESSLPHHWSAIEQMPKHFAIFNSGDIRDQHNNHLRAILASTSAKQVSLTIGLIEAVNKFDFLTYALSARAIVEIIATLRYLLVNKIHPIVQEMTAAGKYDVTHVRRLIKEEDVYLRVRGSIGLSFSKMGFVRSMSAMRSGSLKRKKIGLQRNGSLARQDLWSRSALPHVWKNGLRPSLE